jgi:hypothetical protein
VNLRINSLSKIFVESKIILYNDNKKKISERKRTIKETKTSKKIF